MSRWTLRLATTTYTVALVDDLPQLVAWGPSGVEDGPSPLANRGRVHFITEADAAPVEYAPRGMRPFFGADLGCESRWRFIGASGDLDLSFRDDVTGLETVLCYRTVPDTDVLLRWVELANTGPAPLEIDRFGSAGFCVPSVGARLTFLSGQWAQEFTRQELVLPAGRFSIGSRYGVPGHNYAPWLAVQDAAGGQAWGVALAWPGSWEIDAFVDPSGLTRVRAGRLVDSLVLEPGGTLVSPVAALAYSAEGLDGLSRVWHRYERGLARPGPRPVLYNSWEATTFAVDAAGQLSLARVAADVGAELFVVDDGWFVGRDDDTGGLGDWTPSPGAFPSGFRSFVEDVRALGLDFGLWVEPESVSPRSSLYAEHPEWVYQVDGRPLTLVRNQLLLNLGREDVFEFVWSMLDGLLTDYPISYLKWDLNRPATERAADLDGAHVANYLRVLDRLRAAHPEVRVEACAGGGGRTDHATIARTDVLWPSDNTAPLDRLSVQDGFLLAHAPHLMSSWVTDAPGIFDPRPRSLAFRFVLAMAGVLGIGADLSQWSPAQLAEARTWIAKYKEIREVIHTGEVHRPLGSTPAVQYVTPETTVVLAWNTGPLTGVPEVPGRSSRVRLRALEERARYRSRWTGTEYSGAHLIHIGLPLDWTRTHDAEAVALDRLD